MKIVFYITKCKKNATSENIVALTFSGVITTSIYQDHNIYLLFAFKNFLVKMFKSTSFFNK